MSAGTKDTTVRIPVTLTRGGPFGPGWTAEMNTGRVIGNRFTATAGTAAGARFELDRLITDTLDALNERVTVVIGGSTDYAGCIHLIHAQPGGLIMSIIRDGHSSGSWGGDFTAATALEQVLAHVGGDPQVVHL